MKAQVQIECLKCVPAVTGWGATIYAKLHKLDWVTLSAQATFFYSAAALLYLLWKWRKEAKGP